MSEQYALAIITVLPIQPRIQYWQLCRVSNINNNDQFRGLSEDENITTSEGGHTMQTLSTHWSLVSVLNVMAIPHNTHCTYNVSSEPPGGASNFIVLNGSTEPCVSNLGFHMSVLVC